MSVVKTRWNINNVGQVCFHYETTITFMAAITQGLIHLELSFLKRSQLCTNWP